MKTLEDLKKYDYEQMKPVKSMAEMPPFKAMNLKDVRTLDDLDRYDAEKESIARILPRFQQPIMETQRQTIPTQESYSLVKQIQDKKKAQRESLLDGLPSSHVPQTLQTLPKLQYPFEKDNLMFRPDYKQADLFRKKFVDTATLGGSKLIDRSMEKLGDFAGLPKPKQEESYLGREEKYRQAEEEYPITSIAGTMAGYVQPATLYSGLAKSALQSGGKELFRDFIVRNLAKATEKGLTRGTAKAIGKATQLGAREAIAGAGLGLTEGLIGGEGIKGSLDRASEYGGYGAVGGALFPLLGRGIIKGKEVYQRSKIKPVTPDLKPFTLKTDKVYQPKPIEVSARPSAFERAKVPKGYDDVIGMGVELKPSTMKTFKADFKIGKPMAYKLGRDKTVQSIKDVPKYVQRIEEGANIPRATTDKPHGVYTTPSNVKSPHEDLGGAKYYWKVNDNANVMKFDTNEKFYSNRGERVAQSAGIVPARKFLGDDEVIRMMKTPRKQLAEELTEKYGTDFSKYYDQHEMVEAVGAIEAKNKGYDALYGVDKIDPEFSEFVALNNKAFSPVDSVPKRKIGLKPRTNEARLDIEQEPSAVATMRVEQKQHTKPPKPPKAKVEEPKKEPPKILQRDTTKQIQGQFERPEKKIKFKEIGSKLYTRLFNTNNPLSKFDRVTGANTELFASNSRRAGSTMAHIVNTASVNKKGEVIGESFNSVLKDLKTGTAKNYFGNDSDMVDIFQDYILHKHNISRMKQEKPVFGPDVTAEQSQNVVKWYEQKYPEMKSVKERLQKVYNDLFDSWTDDLVSKELKSKLKEMYPDYVPTGRVLENTPLSQAKGKKGYVNQEAPLKKATGGTSKIQNTLESYIAMIDKTIKASKNNEVGLELLNTLRNSGESFDDIARIVGKPEKLKDIEPSELISDLSEQYTRGRTAKDNIIRVMEKGNLVEIEIKDRELLRNLRGLTEGDSNVVIRMGRSITNPFKALITSKNPLFTVGNIARDIPTAYINSVIRKNPLFFVTDAGRAVKKMITNDKMWQEYLALGGETANFVARDPKQLNKAISQTIKGKNVVKKGFDKVGESIQEVNNFGESMNRFAEYMRTIEKHGDDYLTKMKALKNAAEITTDFSRHGDWIKAMDSWMPYLNPSFQGLDKFGRNLKNKPVKTIAKSLISITAPTLVLNAINNKYAKEAYDKLDNRTKDTYFLIPRDDGTFYKIPKTYQNGAIFGSLFERLIRVSQGQDISEAFKGFGGTLSTNFSPVGSLNPLASLVLAPALYNLQVNKDFAGRTIEPEYLKGRSPELRYDEKTSEMAKTIGSVISNSTGLSPKQIEYLIDSYTGYIGDFLIPATTQGKKAVEPLKRKFIADPLYNNQSIQDFYENREILKIEANDFNIKNDVPSKVVTPYEKRLSSFNKVASRITELKNQIVKIKKSDKSDAEKIKLERELQTEVLMLVEKMNLKYKEFIKKKEE